MLIQNTPSDERPRERCLRSGPSSLSLRECLALILGSGPRGLGCLGLASQILSLPGEGFSPDEAERAFFSALESSPDGAVSEFSGIGEAARARLLASFELSRRYARFKASACGVRVMPARPGLHDLALSALKRVPDALRIEPSEWLGFIPCYRLGEVGGLCMVERGVRTHVNFEASELFARLLPLRPKALFLCHNHPSGDLRPSAQDVELTRRVRFLASELGIELLGHWIVAWDGEEWVDARV